ncbi:MAG: lysophospholipid acyltransferase family protein [Limnospira sp.]
MNSSPERDRTSPDATDLDGWSLDGRDPEFIRSLQPVLGWFYDNYFHVQTDGWENVPDSGRMLIVGSHNGGLAAPDMHMCMYDWVRRYGSDRPIYGLMHPTIWKISASVAHPAVKCGAIQAHPRIAIAALERDFPVLVYPGGPQDVFRPHVMRNQICFAGRRGFIKLALRTHSPILPVISCGAHDTLIVLTNCYDRVKLLHDWGMPWLLDLDPQVFPIYLGLPWGVSLGPLPNFPLPAAIRTRICPPIRFDRYGRDAARDHDYVESCYRQVKTQMQQALDRLVATAELSSN